MKKIIGSFILAVILLFNIVACGEPDEKPAPSAAAIAKEENRAVDAVDQFWREHFRDLSTDKYTSPVIYGGYTGTHGPSCGNEPSVPLNAFYCPLGDFIAWDDNLMSQGYVGFGNYWIYLIIAHEWGHAIQARINIFLLGAVGSELQADCLAGAAIDGAVEDGTLTKNTGDTEKVHKALAAVSDQFPWTSQSNHGTAKQRTAAFDNGTDNGAKSCF